MEFCVFNFESMLEDVMNLINEVFLTNKTLNSKVQDKVKTILTGMITTYPQCREKLLKKLLERFRDISSAFIYNGVLWIIGEYAHGESVTQSLNSIIEAIGPLPITLNPIKTEEQKSDEKEQVKAPTKKFKTVILPDGSYGTELIEEKDTQQTSTQVGEQQESAFRQILASYSYIGSITARTLLKLVFKIKLDAKKFNKFSSQILLTLCSLLRLYTTSNKQFKKNEEYDQDSIEKIYLGVKLLTEPKKFQKEKMQWLESNQNIVKEQDKIKKVKSEQKDEKKLNELHIAKQPDDLIIIRALKGKQADVGDVDLSDEEINQIELKGVGEDNDFASKLNKLVQLTGYSDPIYSESFVYIHKYDILFETLLVNRTTKTLQKVQIEFFTQENDQKRVIEKAGAVTLQPNQSAYVKTSMKFTSIDIGVIFGAINYENTAGVEQAYLITKEIDIDLIDFVFPAQIDFNSYREMWARYEWENRIVINPTKTDLLQFFLQFKKQFKLYMLNSEEEISNATVTCVNFYAKTKLGDDFLINISAESHNGTITGTIRIRSKVKGVVVSIGQKFKQ